MRLVSYRNAPFVFLSRVTKGNREVGAFFSKCRLEDLDVSPPPRTHLILAHEPIDWLDIVLDFGSTNGCIAKCEDELRSVEESALGIQVSGLSSAAAKNLHRRSRHVVYLVIAPRRIRGTAGFVANLESHSDNGAPLRWAGDES